MFIRFKTIAASALIALGALAAVPATAQADSFYFGIGGRQGTDVQFRFGEGGRNWDRDHRGGGRWDRGRGGCSVSQALRKADRLGLNRVHLRGENRNTIRVGGRDRGRNVTVVFARAPGCPVIR